MHNIPLDDITGEIIDAAYKLHVGLGPGLLEAIYETILARDLQRRGLLCSRQACLSFDYDGLHFDQCLRVDLLVENRIVVEIKSVEKILPVHGKQVLTYLRLMRLKVGLLINFGAATLKEGLQRVVNDLHPSASPREPTSRRIIQVVFFAVAADLPGADHACEPGRRVPFVRSVPGLRMRADGFGAAGGEVPAAATALAAGAARLPLAICIGLAKDKRGQSIGSVGGGMNAGGVFAAPPCRNPNPATASVRRRRCNDQLQSGFGQRCPKQCDGGVEGLAEFAKPRAFAAGPGDGDSGPKSRSRRCGQKFPPGWA